MATTSSTEVRLPVPREALLELGLTEDQIAEAEAAAPAVLAFQADEHEGAWFDVERVRRALQAMRAFRHTKGRRWRAQPLSPDPWQLVWVIAPVFGWVYFDEEAGDVVRVIRTVWVEVPRKNGKGLYADEVILTADGWKRFGDLQPGDRVHAVDGSLTDVVAVTLERLLDCYRVTFADGQSVVCDSDHLWTVKDRYGHDPAAWTDSRTKGAWRTVSAPELADGFRSGSRGDTRYSVRMDRVIQRPAADLPIDPYLLGAWLGDGHTAAARITTIDPEIRDAYAAAGYMVRQAGSTVSYGISGGFLVQLRALGVLGNKHVPDVYLTASAEQRMALLQGLMDTDGSADAGRKIPRVEFSSTNPRLADAVLFLARSLGWKATSKESRAVLNGRDVGPRWRVAWTAHQDRPPFRLTRKVQRLSWPTGQSTRSGTNTIVSVERVPTVPTRCIQVAHPSGQFLAGPGLIPTHNSTISSGISLVLLLADGEPGAEVYAAAGSMAQAGRVFDDAKTMVSTAKAAARRCEVLASVIRVPKTGSIFRALSRVAETAHGLNVHGAVIDEVHTLRLRRALVEAIETGTGARDQPLVVFITTADEDEEGTIYDEKHTRTVRVASGVVRDPSHYGVIWRADADDDPFADATLAKANPGAGRSPTWAYLRKEAEKARTTPSYFPTYCRLHLNLRKRDATRWLDLDRWAVADRSIVVREHLAGRRAWGGLDLSAVSDLTAWCVIAESQQPGKQLEMLWRFWLPEGRVDELERQLQVPLRTWARQGWLSLTDGDVIDYTAVQAAVLADCRLVDMQRVSYDRMFAGQLVQQLDEQLHGVDVLPVNQTFLGLSPACKELERLLGAGTVATGGNPVARWHAGCVEVKRDDNDNIRPVKPNRQKSLNRIDGIQAAVTGLDGWLRQPKTGLQRVSGSVRGR